MPLTAPEPTPHALELAGVDLVDASPPYVRVLEARETVVVLSRSRSVAREVQTEQCRADGVPIVVRPSGGGAVVLAPGVVTASVVAAATPPLFPEPYFRRYCSVVARAVTTLGLPPVAVRGVSDLCVGEHKIAGSSLRLAAGKVLFQVSILVDMNVALMERYLKQPSREPDYRAGRSHREFVRTLHELGAEIPPRTLVERVTSSLAAETARA